MYDAPDPEMLAWAEGWLTKQKARLSLIDQCIAAKSLRPFADFLFDRARRVHAAVRSHRNTVVARRDYALTAAEVGQRLGNPQLTSWATSVAKAQDGQVERAERLLDLARDAATHDVARAARLLATEPEEPAEPVYDRSHPAPGVPAWYYPEEES